MHYKKYITARDSIFSEENNKKSIRTEMNFEFEKKQAAEKAEQNKKDAIAAEEIQKQQIILWSVIIGFSVVIVFSAFLYRRFKITQRQKQIIEQQKEEVNKQRELADSRRIIAEEQKEIIHAQKIIVEEKQKEILDSIHYASRIQQAMLTGDEYITKHLDAEYFIFYQPKDIVAGDFYWALSHHNLFYFCTADCTGHGVPGAFMSLLNIGFLNENVIERRIKNPAEILNEQRKEIVKALNPKGTENSKDGMDCVLCAFDLKKMKLDFAAANNPLWLVRNNILHEFKADKMPVGKYEENLCDFNLQSIALQKGDLIYTFTDGYADQFGGPKGKKFMYKQLENTLLNIVHKPMQEQKDILSKIINDWKTDNEQIDDILVVGIKI